MKAKRTLAGVALTLLLLWLGPPLLAVFLRADGLRQDYPDANQLFLAAPLAAITGMVRASGDERSGEYLLRGRIAGLPTPFYGPAWGWHVVWQGGNGHTFARGKERLSGTCTRFSGGFDVCRLSHGQAKK